MANDYQRLKEEADIDQVITFLGIENIRRGSNIFIHCPLPDHNDKTPTNCHYKIGWNNVYCETCNKSINAINLIMLSQGCSMGEAADQLWQLEGEPDWYYDKGYRKGSKPKRKPFQLSRYEADLIGIKFPGWLEKVANESEVKGKNTIPIPHNNSYIVTDVMRCQYQDFCSEITYAKMIKTRAKQKLSDVIKVGKLYRQQLDAGNTSVEPSIKLARSIYDELQSIIKKADLFLSEQK